MADKPLVSNITCHAFNKEGTQIALSPNSHEVWIYETKGNHDFHKWEKKYTLSEHVGHVCSIDWCHTSNRIVTCGHDRNAYVWSFVGNEWQPELVVLRNINRALTQVKWSPSGKKFAATSGMKCVPICNYEAGNNWWVTKIIKKHKSTVLAVDWAPNSKLVVTGSSDYKCRVFSAFLKEIDDAGEDGLTGVFPEQNKFGEMLAEFDIGKSWIHSVAWAPNGQTLAFAAHGSTVHFVHLGSGGAHVMRTVFHKGLPFLDLKYLSDTVAVGVGYDFNPTIFRASGTDAEANWELADVLDKGDKAEKKQENKSAFGSALKKFVQSTDLAIQDNSKITETVLHTKHQNTINNVWIHKPDGKPVAVTTASLDGNVFFWDLSGVAL